MFKDITIGVNQTLGLLKARLAQDLLDNPYNKTYLTNNELRYMVLSLPYFRQMILNGTVDDRKGIAYFSTTTKISDVEFDWNDITAHPNWAVSVVWVT